MKTKEIIAIISLLSSILLPSCQLFDKEGEHTKSFDEISGKYLLCDAVDKRVDIENTYFEIDGSQGNFSLKYYEHGDLKREGIFQKIITREDLIGRYSDNLHFNVKVGDISEHISCYSETFSPIDQFRIIEEYVGSSQDYYLSELPYVLGTYVREGKEFTPEKAHTHKVDYTTPNKEEFTAALNGKFSLSYPGSANFWLSYAVFLKFVSYLLVTIEIL